jgi:hypothetical protein
MALSDIIHMHCRRLQAVQLWAAVAEWGGRRRERGTREAREEEMRAVGDTRWSRCTVEYVDHITAAPAVLCSTV